MKYNPGPMLAILIDHLAFYLLEFVYYICIHVRLEIFIRELGGLRLAAQVQTSSNYIFVPQAQLRCNAAT
jgi:hypothetical protein